MSLRQKVLGPCRGVAYMQHSLVALGQLRVSDLALAQLVFELCDRLYRRSPAVSISYLYRPEMSVDRSDKIVELSANALKSHCHYHTHTLFIYQQHSTETWQRLSSTPNHVLNIRYSPPSILTTRHHAPRSRPSSGSDSAHG
jgi:hypothetical protein